MVHYSTELIDLLLFYIVGMSSIDKDPLLKSLDLLFNRLRQIIKYKLNQKDYFDQRFTFLLVMARYYGLSANEEFLEVIKLFQQTDQRVDNGKYVKWNFSQLLEQEIQIDQNILPRDSKSVCWS